MDKLVNCLAVSPRGINWFFLGFRGILMLRDAALNLDYRVKSKKQTVSGQENIGSSKK
ncbi:hypothetical protein [Salegentibacter holothuriorum]|uniref:hypothetical protein n=1 Tax=Salegentibacter holothuriorum TaxID=241145 RepID=UPI001591A3FD|nr:hypothetical protein [Salegentibacter holothuriorum]